MDQVRIDDGVKEVIVDGVVDVCVLVVVAPLCLDEATGLDREGGEGEGRTSVCGRRGKRGSRNGGAASCRWVKTWWRVALPHADIATFPRLE